LAPRSVFAAITTLKLTRRLRDRSVQIRHDRPSHLPGSARARGGRGEVAAFIDDDVSHNVLEVGELVVAYVGDE
jgi:hypothetical protein